MCPCTKMKNKKTELAPLSRPPKASLNLATKKQDPFSVRLTNRTFGNNAELSLLRRTQSAPCTSRCSSLAKLFLHPNMISAHKDAASSADSENLIVDDASGRNAVPSTTITKIDIGCPKPTTSSTSTTTSIATRPTQTATSAPQQPTLQTLNDDILTRIACHVLADSRRGSPHYPSKECPDALRFAQASATLSDAIARQVTSDLSWLDISDADTTMTGLKPAFMQKVLAWYTITAPYITSLHLHSKLTYFPNLRTRVMDKLLDSRPPLKFINLSSFDKMAKPFMHADLMELLNYSRETISSITIDLTPKLLEVVCKARLTSVTTMDVKVGPFATADGFFKLLKSVSSQESPLRHLTMHTVGSLPEGLIARTFFAAVPQVQSLEFHDGGMENSVDSLKAGFLRLARLFEDLQSVSLHNCHLDLSSLHSLLDREKHPAFDTLELVKCVVYDLEAVLAATSDRLTRLELTELVDRTALQAIGRCKNVRVLGLTMGRDVVEGLKECLMSLKELRGLTLSLHGDGARVERQVIEALEHTGANFEKFVLHGETLQYEGIRHIMRILGPQLQYLVTGIYTPTKSRTKIIMRLLKDTAQHNPNLKILCFGLGLTYDRRGAELHEQFLHSIEWVGTKLQGLDTYWLKRNANSILELERPQDFVDYQSDESDVEEV